MSTKVMTRLAVALCAVIVVGAVSLSGAKAGSKAAARADIMVRLALVTIDGAQLEAYKAILAEEQEASVRLEPGVVMLHSVQYSDDPTQIRLLEVYASRAAYDAHIRSPHFLKYKTSTEKMVKSLQLVPTNPIMLCAKSRGLAGGAATCI